MPKSDSKSDTTQKIRILPLLALAVVMMVPAALPAGPSVQYNITDLGTLEGYDISRVWSINNEGQIVGEVLNPDPPDTDRAVLFDASGEGNNIDLGTLGGETGWAQSINNNGQIVGAALDNNDDCRATIFEPNGGGSNIAISTESVAVSNNDNGQIVGSVLGLIFLERQAVLFDINDANDKSYLGSIPGFSNSEAYSINNAGQIAGYAYNGFFEESRAVLFDTTGSDNNIDLGTLGGQNSAALSINNEGQIVGRADTASGAVHATLFDPNGTGNNIDLGTLSNCTFFVATSINNDGQIVGQASPDGIFSTLFRAVLFDPTGCGNNIDLNELVDPALGWTLKTAICINDNGWIVGWGSNPDGYSRSFLLTPAKPADLEPDGDVDLADFAVFASAWQSRDGEPNWNVFCDISSPEDGVVDELDLAVFCSNWLAQQ
jgi:probable HAF family extracellular repeat protein